MLLLRKRCNCKIPYSKLWLCKDHYIKYIQRRVLETIKRYKLIKKGQKILVGVSGVRIVHHYIIYY